VPYLSEYQQAFVDKKPSDLNQNLAQLINVSRTYL
jgi:hypothetical protein